MFSFPPLSQAFHFPSIPSILCPWLERAAGELLSGLAAAFAAPPVPSCQGWPTGHPLQRLLFEKFLFLFFQMFFLPSACPLGIWERFHIVSDFASVYLMTIKKTLILDSYFLLQTVFFLLKCLLVNTLAGSLCVVEDSALQFVG